MSIIQEVHVDGHFLTQEATIEVENKVTLTMGADHFALTNQRRPRNYNHFRWEKGQPFEFDSIRVLVPEGYVPMGYPMNRAERIETDREDFWFWELVARSEYLPDPRHFPGKLTDRHGLTGGEQYAVRFVNAETILQQAPPVESLGGLAKMVGVNFRVFQEWPRATDVLKLFGSDGTLEDRNGDLFAYMAATGKGWYRWGDVYWGGGHSNMHYSQAVLAMMNGLANKDDFALTLGIEMAWHQATLGLCHSIDEDVTHRGMQQYEKGHERLGSYYPPASYKQWALTTELAAAIFPHPVLLEARQIRRDFWLNRDLDLDVAAQLWDGQWGERNGGRYLDWLRACWIFDEENRATYEAWARAFQYVAQDYAREAKWYANHARYPHVRRWPWQQAQTIATMDWWYQTIGYPDETAEEEFRLVVEEFLRIGISYVEPFWRCHYEMPPPGNDEVVNPGGPTTAAQGIPVLAIAIRLGIEDPHGRDLQEMRRGIEEAGIGKAGQITQTMDRHPALSIADLQDLDPSIRWSFRGGVNFALGSAGPKSIAEVAEAAFLWSRD